MFGPGRATQRPCEVVLADDDIRQLLSFCPPPATFQASRTKSRLLRTTAIQERLNQLLSKTEQPIAIDELPRKLGVEEDGLRSADIDLSRTTKTADNLHIVSGQRIGELVGGSLDRHFVNVEAEAKTHQIKPDCLVSLVKLYAAPSIESHVTDVDGAQYVSSPELLSAVTEQIRSALVESVWQARTTSLLSNLDHNQPLEVVKHVATELIAHEGIKGSIEANSKDLIFIPDSAVQSQDVKSQHDLGAQVDSLVTVLKENGFCKSVGGLELNRDDILHEVETKLQKEAQILDRPLVVLIDPEPNKSEMYCLVLQTTLEGRQHRLAAAASESANEAWRSRPLDKDFETKQTLDRVTFTNSNLDTLDKLLITSAEHNGPIIEAWNQTISDQRSQTETELLQTLYRDAIAPLTLYSKGVKTLTSDETLQSRTRDHATIHLRTEILDPATTQIRSRKLVTSRTAHLELDRLVSAIKDARDLDALQSALKRFQRKGKLPSTTTTISGNAENVASEATRDNLASVKTRILEAKYAAMERMRRASDLLQHATWILLACLETNGECLFVSAGKDASRMIKLYSALAREGGEEGKKEQEWAVRLETLRDQVKAGTDEEGSKKALRELAGEALQMWSARAAAINGNE